MAHKIGTAVTTQDLLTQLHNFVTAAPLGWTTPVYDPNWVRPGTTGSNRGHVIFENPAGDAFWEIIGYDTTSGTCELAVIPSTGYNADPNVGIGGQPGNYYGNGTPGGYGAIQSMNFMGYPFTSFQIFATNQYIHLVIEHQPGKFRHMHIGTLNKRSGYTGGQYSAVTHLDNENAGYWTTPFTSYNGCMPWDSQNNGYQYGVYSATVVRVDVDGLSPGWFVATNNPNGNPHRLLTEYSGDDDLQLFMGSTPNTYNQLSAGIPILVDASRTGTTTFYSPLGEPADVRIVKYGNYAPAQIQTIGADQWVMFPQLGVPGLGATESDQGFGLMYRIVT